MRKYPASQKKIITDFLTTVSAAWFGAGVVTSVFTKQEISFSLVKNLAIGVLLSFFTLQYALYLDKKK